MTTPDTEEFPSEETAVAEDVLETGQGIQEEGAGDGPEPEPPEPPKYYVSFQRLEELDRSAVVLVAARRVESCPSMSKPLHELTDAKALIATVQSWEQKAANGCKSCVGKLATFSAKLAPAKTAVNATATADDAQGTGCKNCGWSFRHEVAACESTACESIKASYKGVHSGADSIASETGLVQGY